MILTYKFTPAESGKHKITVPGVNTHIYDNALESQMYMVRTLFSCIMYLHNHVHMRPCVDLRGRGEAWCLVLMPCNFVTMHRHACINCDGKMHVII